MAHKPWDVIALTAVQATAGDDASAKGMLQLDGTNAVFKGSGIPLHAITGWKYEAYVAGTAHAVDEDYTGTNLVVDHEYTVTVKFLTNVLTSYTFSVIYEGTAPLSEDALIDDLIAKINETSLGFTAANDTGDVLSITVDDVASGEIIVTDSEGGSWTDKTAYVAPVGTAAELLDQAGVTTTDTFDRLRIFWNREGRHNGVSGAIVATAVESKMYVNEAGAEATDAANLKTRMENILNGIPNAGAIGAITDGTGGTADGTLADVTGSFDQAVLNNNFADIAEKINAIQATLDSGIWTGVASL